MHNIGRAGLEQAHIHLCKTIISIKSIKNNIQNQR